jgi:signal transduction histidine kinase
MDAPRSGMARISRDGLRGWTLPGRPAPAAEDWRDIVLVAGVALVQVVGSFGASRGQPEREALDPLAIVLLLAGPAMLLARRRYPAGVLAAVLSTSLLYMVLGYPYGPVILSDIVAIYTAVTSGRRWVAWAGMALLYGVHMAYRIMFDARPGLAEMLGVGAWLLLIVVGAEVARAYRERAAERAHTEREEARRLASEERLRIARELHDVLAHHISLINVQAGVGLHLMDRRPEQARTALAAIEEASREAMGELRTVLDILHRPDEAAPRSPAPSLSRLDTLRQQAAAAGLEVRVELHGERAELGAAVDAAAYRVVQEAVTNVIRHAAASVATIDLAYSEHELAIAVEDNGTRLGGPVRPGKGLSGMRERVEALGGRFEAGPLPMRGFRVRAWLPTGPAAGAAG